LKLNLFQNKIKEIEESKKKDEADQPKSNSSIEIKPTTSGQSVLNSLVSNDIEEDDLLLSNIDLNQVVSS
jgi:hypothetical protein